MDSRSTRSCGRGQPCRGPAVLETSHEVSSLTLSLVQGVVGALDQVDDVSGVVGVTGDTEARRQWSVLERIALDDRAHALGVDDRGRQIGRASWREGA